MLRFKNYLFSSCETEKKSLVIDSRCWRKTYFQESTLASQTDFSFSVRLVSVSLFPFRVCPCVEQIIPFSNGFCTNQLSILVSEKNRFEIKKIILNGFKIAGSAKETVKSLSLPNERMFILNH